MNRVYVFLADGFETVEALAPVDVMRRAGLQVTTVSIMGRLNVESAQGVVVMADELFENIAFDDDDQKLRNSSFTLADNYRDFGGGYIIPWVASNPGRKFQLKATPSDNFKSEGYTDVKFVIPASSGKHKNTTSALLSLSWRAL